MINAKILTSILENHRLTDEQSEELQKVIYMLNDGRLAEAKPPFEKADRIDILYLCDEKLCEDCRRGGTDCMHTTHFDHAKNYESFDKVDLEKDFTFQVISPNHLMFVEKER